jgi:hypothetical protein
MALLSSSQIERRGTILGVFRTPSKSESLEPLAEKLEFKMVNIEEGEGARGKVEG